MTKLWVFISLSAVPFIIFLLPQVKWDINAIANDIDVAEGEITGIQNIKDAFHFMISFSTFFVVKGIP